MPNWCNGWIEVKGKAKNVKEFCKLFIFTGDFDDDGKGEKKKYFARSFMNRDWKGFEEDYFQKLLKNPKDDEEIGIDFSMEFAWSCHSCMIDGYPTDKNNKDKSCVTLMWACKKYKVDVHIETEEPACYFEEDITCDSKGNLDEQCKDMPVHTCQNCGKTQAIPSSYDLDEEECYECNAIGEWKDKLKTLLNKRLEKENER